MTPENSDQAIDARIDVLIGKLPIGPHKTFLTEVYRPYCKAMMKMANRGDDGKEVADAFCVLLSNMIREAAMTLARDHKRMAAGILAATKLILKNSLDHHLRK
jgi:hypothetical protein